MADNGRGGEPSILERGSHHRLWKLTVPGPNGQPLERQIMELATGLYYQQQGQWRETQEQFELAPDGSFIAQQGPHRVVLAKNLNTREAVQVQTPGLSCRSANISP